ncbi:hypothetical protein NE235_10245 [Actinoallomurus spadix]|uniref:Uncharacterized protein n=1 Tax=Actinoallomurus spadix TaxID=79912 RepID=A0ABN0WUL3_9ACTN|nr:hypothetical protein [Actinoallomurus spadix]MCO5986483.1 hypothetical protein [Actinoallomurus spadix]
MTGRRRPRREPPVRQEADASQIAVDLERRCPGWVVIWSAWRRAFTAFSAVTAESLVIDDPSAYRLLQRISEAQRAAVLGARASTGRITYVPAAAARDAGAPVAGGEGPATGGPVRPGR